MRSIWLWTAVAVSVFAVGCRQTPMERLIAASRGVRVTEARICDFPYARLSHATRGGESVSPTSLRVRATAGELLNSIDGTDPDTEHIRALSQFLWDRSRKAEEDLEAVISADPANARAWNDLAAVRYELAQANDDAHGLVSALAAAARAMEIDSALPEARFNFALAAAAVHLNDVAANSFRGYLVSDGNSEWASEARERLAALEQRRPDWKQTAARIERIDVSANDIHNAVAAFPQQARTWAEVEYLGRWATAYLAQCDADAAHWLSLSRHIGEALRARSGESLLHDAIRAIDASETGRSILAKAHSAYQQGRLLYGKQNAADAIPLLKNSEELFAAGASPMALVARCYRASALTDRGEDAPSLPLLESAGRGARPGYDALRAQILRQQGYIASRRGHIFAALDYAKAALTIFERLQESDNAASMLTNIAATDVALGQPAEAWRIHQRAFSAASAASSSPTTREHAIHAAARDALREHDTDVARALFDIELQAPTTSPRLRADALLHRLSLGTAEKDYRLLRAAANGIPDPRIREEALDDIGLAEVRTRTDAIGAIETLNRSIEFRSRSGLTLTLPDAYVQRARALRRAGQDDKALEDFRRAVEIIEDQRTSIPSNQLRDSFAETAVRAYLELFKFYIDRRDFKQAFEAAERAREGVPHASNTGEPIDPEDVRRRLDATTLIAQYTVLDNAVAILTISRSGIQGRVVAAPNLHGEIEEFAQAIDGNEVPAARRQSEALFRILVEPIVADLRGKTDLVIIPDTTLASCPFVALSNPTTHRYLVEDAVIRIAPNAAFTSQRSRGPRFERALLIGNPTLGSRFPDLGRLAAAEQEVRNIAALYPKRYVLLGDDASPGRIVREMVSSDLIHIGTHAIVSPVDASLSLLVCAPSAGDDGILYLRDIAGLHFSRPAVVVLAGCRTASLGGGHGSVRTLAMAFLAAGATSAIASSWNVPDEQTQRLTTELHRQLATGIAPAQALRNAQLMMLRSADGSALKSWGGFQLYGM